MDQLSQNPPPQQSHYHIRWSQLTLDWERFDTRENAEERATQLVRDGETYTVEAFDGACARCGAFKTRHGAL